MPKQVFIPLTDDLLFDSPDLICGPIVAYAPGMVCGEWLEVELNPQNDPHAIEVEPDAEFDAA